MSVSPPHAFTRPSREFRITVEPDRHRVLVAPHGELDLATVPELADELDGLVERGFRAIVIDLRPTTFIDSSAVHLLFRQTARPDATVTVIAGPRCVMRVLDIAGARDTLPFEPAP
ncbi:MAG TPA: STAS domain-containing protein [Solirubrobacteraceae bacterium]|nr:STAS domain-containing protein [Solirubrobacteraceae bacterium]